MISKQLSSRLNNQGLSRPIFKSPLELVTWFGAVQAQDYGGAAWAVGQRIAGAVESDIDQALADGSLIRTHVMRPTWHFVPAADVRWMLSLTASRIHTAAGHRRRELELDKSTFSRANKALTKGLRGGNHLTRAEIVSVLKKAGIAGVELRFGHILMQAELEQLVCSGRRKGKQLTYALFDERVPASKPKPREEAVAELALRYFTSHGPATLPDYAWWSGLNAADARTGLEMAKAQLTAEVIDGQTYWLSSSALSTSSKAPAALLLPNYDEYIVAYKDRSALYDGSHDHKLDARGNVLFNHTMIANGQIVGIWRRIFKGKAVMVELTPFIEFTKVQQKAFAAAANRYGQFLKMPEKLKYVDGPG